MAVGYLNMPGYSELARSMHARVAKKSHIDIIISVASFCKDQLFCHRENENWVGWMVRLGRRLVVWLPNLFLRNITIKKKFLH